MRYRLTYDVDTNDPDVTLNDVQEAASVVAMVLSNGLAGAYVDLEAIEELGT